ncbi:hypothetical protein QYH69_34040 [Paraburkholderia sp. SARCC-3016]|uniref:hypothetical protein n=1 Tax=Paraburkholderia sp. SARCC-3016 TaxID=3058611 RepID=UPI0028083FDB|nr:hypothetical protein [Paraburkholderia sp. SARCC-3016]MDQ7982247.1 hypothetical protein [Paraburkholderia sp. SARCC-3016]
MRIHISYGPTRPKPRVGDRRVTKKHGEQIPVFQRSQGSYVVSNGRPCYEWVPISEAKAHGAAHHWTPEERAKYDNEYAAGYMQQRGAA